MMKNKIDTTKWENFVIEDLFNIKRPSARSQSDYEAGEIPFIASGNYNNGVLKYLMPKDNEVLDKGNCITVSPVDGSSFYQKEDFLGRGGAGSSIILLYNDHLNEKNGTFIATIIRKICSKYGYSDMGSKESIKKEIIKIPVDDEKNPDWSYMEQYMKNIEKKVLESVELLSRSNNHNNKMNISEWKPFHLYDIFEIDSGTKMDKVAMKFDNPTINFVGRSGINNGVTAIVDEIDEYKPYEAGNLTLALGGALGSCFVQEKNFYTSQNVIVLIPKCEMSINAKQFICSVIFKEGNMHYKAFIDELNRHIKTDFTIMLPVDSKTGEPDYEYMDKFMKKIKNIVINKYKILKSK